MDLINNLLVGFEAALSLQNILYCFFGVTIGTLIGVLRGWARWQRLRCFCPPPTRLIPLRPSLCWRYLLRRAVRGLNHRHSCEYSRRSRGGCDLYRRPQDG